MQTHDFPEEPLLLDAAHVLGMVDQHFLGDELEGEVEDDDLIAGGCSEGIKCGMFVFGVVSS